MLLNRVEFALMNNPLRAGVQRRFEARRLLAMGGAVPGGLALEVGCGPGVGIGLVLDLFGAERVEAFDLDPRMVRRARRRCAVRGARVALWVGDATALPVKAERYDAVFDFGIVHHVPDWRAALAEIARVLKPGGRLFAEEVFGGFLGRSPWRQLFRHPRTDRFECDDFCRGLEGVGLDVLATRQLWGSFGWFVAAKPTYGVSHFSPVSGSAPPPQTPERQKSD